MYQRGNENYQPRHIIQYNCDKGKHSILYHLKEPHNSLLEIYAFYRSEYLALKLYEIVNDKSYLEVSIVRIFLEIYLTHERINYTIKKGPRGWFLMNII